MYRKPNVSKEKSKKEKKITSSFLVPPKNKIQFHPVKTTPMLQNAVAFSMFKKQILKETALNSPSMKECRK